tara:strand:- start:2743 stop:3384 length:642 start_codon:yes stop_codon:yes gene_type:complete
MHGKQGMLVISIEPSEEEQENARLQKIAHNAGKVQVSHGRSPDLVLMDNLKSEFSPEEVLKSYTKQKEYEAGFGFTKGLDELDMLRQAIPGESGDLEGKLYKKMHGAKKDMEDYQKFGGDMVSMELDRDEDCCCHEMNESDDDLLSSMALNGADDRDLSDIERALVAMREHVGDDAYAEVAGMRDGHIVLNVATPSESFMYAYNVQTGSGSFL